MEISFVDLKAQYDSIKADIDAAIKSVIDNTAFIGGPIVREFQAKFAEKYGVKHCVAVANGTDAIYIALRMIGIGDGDEVITTAHSWISTSETISQTGAKPVFVDVEPDYFTIDPEKIEEKITERTKAIIPVHIYGQVCDMDRIMAIAKKHKLKVLEDTAQAHFSEYRGTRAGLIGDVATFSFYPGKNLGAYGDAGAIITNDDELAENMRMFANHGALIKHQHKMEGINSRLDTLQAAILAVKLNHILDWTQARRDCANRYDKLLGGIDGLVIPKVRPNSKHSYHLYVIRTDRRDELKSFLASKGVPTVLHYPTILPLLKPYEKYGYTPENFPVAYQNQNTILSIPIYPELPDDHQAYIVEQIAAFFNK
ncbi:erythromycin biosynthesis sensory transduction protein eryC1 [Roseivirga sp. 4D4]|uniref:DegT/DnrJ/EryC1/StrS family aminotransferase n=1 Tax=Roseivirga sp. 4D4 TaxID=1889784 RepID=UPI0008531483|nr:DegT/DnrJ/EryC1/StrS family aminotransferase [Roseivirga sp. 4D4]OEK02490.1 erythromycin biosynthesis sensory transduction protein eryC1 [Roseivirga sp. 4D4]